MKKIEIRQIYYNDETRAGIVAPFIPLDNTQGDKSWFEFWPILHFLYNHELQDDTLYGFLSPKFTKKTGITPTEAMSHVRANSMADAILFSYGWDQLAYFLNPWEQAEPVQPGIMSETQKFLDAEHIRVQLKYMITSCHTAVFSNYIVANKTYWSYWKNLAERFFLYTEFSACDLGKRQTAYNYTEYPMKVFIQERFPALILALARLKTATVQCTNKGLVPIFADTAENRKLLELCSQIKDQIICGDLSQAHIQQFLTIRRKISFVGGPKMQWGYPSKQNASAEV